MLDLLHRVSLAEHCRFVGGPCSRADGARRTLSRSCHNAGANGSEIAPAFVVQAKQQLWQAIDNDDLIGDWFARFMTTPKYPELVDMTQEVRRASWRNRRYCNGDVENDTG